MATRKGKSDAFLDYLHEVFAEFGPISIRRMFGGHGIFRDGLMFAILNRETLYLKADDENIGHFIALGLGRMRYSDGTEIKIRYYEAPSEMIENPEIAAEWGKRSFAAALRAQKKKK